MKGIMIILVFIFLAPIVYSGSCLDIICDLDLKVWNSSGCYSKICVQEKSAEEAYECYGILCNQDIASLNQSTLNRSCQNQFCGNYSEIKPKTNTSVNTSTLQSLQSQLSLLNATLNELDRRLDKLEADYNSVQTTIRDLNNKISSTQNAQNQSSVLYSQLKAELDKIQSSIQEINNKIESTKKELAETLSPSKRLFTVYILIAVITVGLFTFSTINLRQIKKLKKRPHLTEIQKNQIVGYIREWSKRGYSFESIKKGLMQQGWTKEQIKEAYGRV